MPRGRGGRDVPAVSAGRAHAASRRVGARRLARAQPGAHARAPDARGARGDLLRAARLARRSCRSSAWRRASCCSPAAARRARFIRRLQARSSALPVTTVNREEGPAYGAALLAAVGAGAFPISPRRRARRSLAAPLEAPDPQAHRDYDAAVRALPRSRSCRATGSSRMSASPPTRRTRDWPRPTSVASQETGLVIVVVLVTSRSLTLLAGSHVDRRTGRGGQQLLELVHADADRHRRELLRDHGDRRDDGDHLRRDRSVRRIDLRAVRRGDGAGAARDRADGARRDGRCSASPCASASGLLCGLLNGALVVGLRVHPFIITLGTMWVLRGIAFVATKAESILVPASLTRWRKRRSGSAAGSIRCRCCA